VAGGLAMQKIWHLELGDEVIAKLQYRSCEFPWIDADIVDSPKFERYRSYFSDFEDWPETQEFDDLRAEIEAKGDFRLCDQDTGKVKDMVTLYENGDFVTFRFAPFFGL
jgi:hypothetical protein